jgi:hypothetical protein
MKYARLLKIAALPLAMTWERLVELLDTLFGPGAGRSQIAVAQPVPIIIFYR